METMGDKQMRVFSLPPTRVPPIARQPERHGNRVTWPPLSTPSIVLTVVPALNSLPHTVSEHKHTANAQCTAEMLRSRTSRQDVPAGVSVTGGSKMVSPLK